MTWRGARVEAALPFTDTSAGALGKPGGLEAVLTEFFLASFGPEMDPRWTRVDPNGPEVKVQGE